MNPTTVIAALEAEAIASTYNPTHVVTKEFADCCTGWAQRSRARAAQSEDDAIGFVYDFVGDYDLSRTEFYEESFADLEEGDPAMDALLESLAKYGSIRLSDYTISMRAL